MKYAITADLQFDLYNKLSYADPEFLTTRLRDQIECFRWIVEKSVECGCTGLIIVGDVFECRTEIDVGVLDIVCREFVMASQLFEDISMVVGNHDSRLRTPELSSLQVFNGIATVYSEPHVVPSGFTSHKPTCDLCFVPWYDDYELIKADVNQCVKGSKAKRKYLFAHVMVEGAVPMAKGMPLSYLRPKEFEQVFLGDVHDPIEITDNVRYCGSPMHIDYRDAGRDAGFYTLDTKTGEYEFVTNILSPKFHIIDDVDTMSIKDGDYVRIKTDDPEIAEEAMAAAGKKTKHVESTFVELEDKAPRLDVHASDAHAAVLERYCEHNGITDNEELVQVGLELLEEARVG